MTGVRSPRRRWIGCAVAAMLVAAALPASAMTLAAAAPTGVNSSAARPGTVTRLTYGSGPLAHPYLVYTPSGWRPRDHWPLLVMLHGCETTAEQQMQANLYNPLANKKHFVVAYPDTSPLEDAQPGPTARCWQFPSPTDWIRGQGDGAAVAAITKVVTRDWNIDSERVYVMGMSAGSFLSADLAAEYPDLYAASGENAGGAYADGTCLVQSVASLPVTLSARLAEEQMGPRARVVPRIVIGGDHDQGVPPACADKALMQGLRTDNLVVDDTQTAPISLTPKSVVHRQVPHGYSYTVSDYRDHHGCLVGQRYLVHGMNHFWSGGSSKPTLKYFTDPKGPSAAVASWKFFSKFTLGNTADPCRAPIRDDRSHLITRRTNGVHVTVAKRIGPRVIELTVKTPAFAQPTHVDVDLPVGYWAHPRKRWPVTYFLAGIMNTYASLNSVVDGVALTRHFPSIVVSPNGDSGWWSNWYNGGKGGVPEYETFVIHQLIPLIDRRFRAIPTRAERAVVGVSMGGYGAMMLAARHPDLFGEAASLSGAVDTDFQPIAAVLTASPTFQGEPADAIFGSQATQEIRWRGHNPTDLAANLRDVDLQVRTANGIPNPGIGEKLLSADTVSCIIEAGVHQGSVDFDHKLNSLGIPHLWKDYGPGCHTPPNFEREISATLKVLTKQFAHPPATPSSFSYRSIEPSFRAYGWHIAADPKRALEFLQLQHVRRSEITLIGSGLTKVTTPATFRGVSRVRLTGAVQSSVRPDAAGRIRFTVDLGSADTHQQFTTGATTKHDRRTVTIQR